MQKLGVINGLRGVAILAVIYQHMFFKLTLSDLRSFNFSDVTLTVIYSSSGWLGVNLFFILSGFVLSYPYFLEKREVASINNIKLFYFNRAKRLLPLYYFSVVFSIIFITEPSPIKDFIKELLLLATISFNFTNDMWFPRYNGVLWSLGIEIWFSIIFPFLIISIRKYGMIKILFIVLAISLGTRIIGNSELYNIGNPVLNPVKDSLLGRLDEFLWGIFTSYVYIKKINLTGKMRAESLFFTGIIMITISCFLWTYVVSNLVTHSIIPFINIILDIGYVMLTLSLLIMKNNIIKWFFSNYIIQLFGVMCYSLYIWHGIAIPKIISEHDSMHIIKYFCMLFILSSLSYRFIEFGYEANVKKLFLLNHK